MLSGVLLSCESVLLESWCLVGLFWLESVSGSRGSLSGVAGASGVAGDAGVGAAGAAGAAASWLLLLWKLALQKATG